MGDDICILISRTLCRGYYVDERAVHPFVCQYMKHWQQKERQEAVTIFYGDVAGEDEEYNRTQPPSAK